MNLFKTCRACGAPDVTSAYREVHYVVLCAECNTDFNSSRGDALEDTPVETLALFPQETGVLKYNPFKPSLQGGGR